MIVFRFLKRTDAATLKGIISLYSRQGWWGKDDKPALAVKIMANSHCFLVALDNGRPVGMGRAISDSANDAYIQDVMVLPEYRRLGLGGKIVLRLKKRLKADGIRWVGLIAQDNSSPFYAKLGFKPIARALPMMLKGNHV